MPPITHPGPIGKFISGVSQIEVSPTYFFPPGPPSAPIGKFKIQHSAIGNVQPFNWQDTVISQYGNSPRLLQLIENFNSYLDQTDNIGAFFDNMWNIDTAIGYGLDVWGRILGISRTLPVDSGSYLGFEEAGDATEVGFDQDGFYAGPPTTSNYALTDSAYRVLLLAKAAANICDGSIPAINRLLMGLFPNRGNAFVQESFGDDGVYFGFAEDGDLLTVGFDQESFKPPATGYFGFAETGDDFTVGFDQEIFNSQADYFVMALKYIFMFPLSQVEQSIVNNSGVLPTPTGVKATVVINP